MATSTIKQILNTRNLPSGSTREELLQSFDAMVPEAGMRFGYISAANASLIGLAAGGHFILLSHSSTYRMIIYFHLTGYAIKILAKGPSGWPDTWKTINLT